MKLNTEEVEIFTSRVPLFSGLSQEEYQTICKAMVQRTFRAGETIVYEDDTSAQTFFIIISGKVHVTVTTPDGKQTILATLGRGDFFGEMSILDQEPRSASVVVVEECTLFMLYRNTLLNIIRKYPGISVQMLIALSKRLRRSNQHVNSLLKMSVYGRIADVILRLAKEQGERFDNIIVIKNPPAHKELAEMAGTSRETVSRVLSQLRQKHLITTDRKRMVILNEEELYN